MLLFLLVILFYFNGCRRKCYRRDGYRVGRRCRWRSHLLRTRVCTDDTLEAEAIVYPSDTLHQVVPVTRGERLVAITFIQSRIQDPFRRNLLYDLNPVDRLALCIGDVNKHHPDAAYRREYNTRPALRLLRPLN